MKEISCGWEIRCFYKDDKPLYSIYFLFEGFSLTRNRPFLLKTCISDSALGIIFKKWKALLPGFRSFFLHWKGEGCSEPAY
jgi:hypothetical protein